MTQTLLFPGLGLELEINRVAFSIGSFSIYWYGVIIATGLLCGVLYAMKHAPSMGIDTDKLMDILLIGAVGAIVGARLYYVAFSWDSFQNDLMAIFRIRDGGIAIYGGILGAILVGSLAAKAKGVKILPLTDLAFSGFLIGQGIGRWGNFVNIEAFGSNTTMPWGMTGPSIVGYLQSKQADLATTGVIVDPNMPVHPTFFYESLWCLIGFAIVAWYTKRRKFDGELTLFYIMWYGAGRFVIEGLRTDSLMWGQIRVSQIFALLSVIVALMIRIYIAGKIKKSTDPDFLKPFGMTGEGKAVAIAEMQRHQEEKRKKKGTSESDVLPSDPSVQEMEEEKEGSLENHEKIDPDK